MDLPFAAWFLSNMQWRGATYTIDMELWSPHLGFLCTTLGIAVSQRKLSVNTCSTSAGKSGSRGRDASYLASTPRTVPCWRDSRTLCSAPHKSSYVASGIMWRPAGKRR